MQSQILSSERRKGRIQRGLAWLESSGVQKLAPDPDSGAVHAWLDTSTGQPAYLYSEITGYFITFCVQLQRYADVIDLSRSEADQWLERARAAALWLIRVAQHESGAILSRKYAGDVTSAAEDPWSFSGGRVAFFDCAMVGFGLTELYAKTSERCFLDAALRIGHYLSTVHESDDQAALFAASNAYSQKPVREAERWSQHFGPFELKSALFLCSLDRLTESDAYRGLALRVLERALAKQAASGRFATHPQGAATHLHPHAYTIEGLLYLAASEGRRDLMPSAERAVDWMFKSCLLAPLPLQQWATEPELVIEGTRSDALAQALRAFEIAKLLEPSMVWDWEPHVTTLYERVCSFETESGGTAYGIDERGDKRHHENTWAQLFRLEMDLFGLVRHAHTSAKSHRFALT